MGRRTHVVWLGMSDHAAFVSHHDVINSHLRVSPQDQVVEKASLRFFLFKSFYHNEGTCRTYLDVPRKTFSSENMTPNSVTQYRKYWTWTPSKKDWIHHNPHFTTWGGLLFVPTTLRSDAVVSAIETTQQWTHVTFPNFSHGTINFFFGCSKVSSFATRKSPMRCFFHVIT